ncbi:MAG: YebC/PmpR family DNA-binding transcriptional regulator [Candidatus Staskawiczbacteria bacterium]|jgi:YebC/PmpR family DNA-binding regulatory protein
MSGHSHFKTIKAQKEVADAKRGKVFSKMGKVVSIAAKNGGDPATNPRLRIAIEQARNVNMPKENIERAILRGTGELAGDKLEEVVFEGFGPGGIAVIIEAITDNKNRTLGEIKQILSQNNGKLAGEGAVQWMFERKGIIVVNTKDQSKDIKNEELELLAIEGGADDISWQGDILGIYTKPDSVETIKKNLETSGIKIDSTTAGLIPKDTVAVDDKAKQNCQKLFDALEENDAVQETYSNLRD